MWHSNETWNLKWNEILNDNLVKLYVHCEINEITKFEMTFKIKTKLDTSKWTQLQIEKKNFQKKVFKKKIFSKIFFLKIILKRNFLQQKIF